MPEFEIGTSYELLENIQELTTPLELPKSEYFPYARTVNLGSGHKRGIGFAMATWTFPIMTVEQRDQLKEFCPDASGEIYIRTKLNDDTYAAFVGIMIWPENEERWYGHKRNYQIVFRNLIPLGEGS
jgi:hypothetical protein